MEQFRALSGFQVSIFDFHTSNHFEYELQRPEEVIQLDFTMPDLNHTSRKGHRIMVRVQSSWFPLADRSAQSFVDIPNARPERLQEGYGAGVPQ